MPSSEDLSPFLEGQVKSVYFNHAKFALFTAVFHCAALGHAQGPLK